MISHLPQGNEPGGILHRLYQEQFHDCITCLDIFRRRLGGYHSFFLEEGQQDAHECLVQLLDILHETTKKDWIPPSVGGQQELMGRNPRANKGWKESLVGGESPITHYFFGQLKSTLCCKVCGSKRESFQVFNTLSLGLELVDKISLEECFSGFFRVEVLDSETECTGCNRNTKTSKGMTVWRFPYYFILHLKRYYHPNGRNPCRVDFNDTINFSHIRSNGIRKQLTYEVICVIDHIGHSPDSGHYRIKRKIKDKWWVFDDNIVYPMETEKINSKYAYIIILKKQ